MISRDLTGSSELPDETDEFDFDVAVESTPKPSLPATTLVAMTLLRRVLQDDEWLKADGVAIIVITPGGDYVEPTASAWCHLVAEARHISGMISVGKIERVARALGADDKRRYFEIKRTGEKGDKATVGNDAVSYILSSGRTVVGFAPSERFLPADLVCAEHV